MENEKKSLLKPLLVVLAVILFAGGTGFGVWWWQIEKGQKQSQEQDKQNQDKQKELDPLKQGKVVTPKPPDFQVRTVSPMTIPSKIAPPHQAAARPKTVGDSDCIAKTNEALNLLQIKDPDKYLTVMEYVGKIECIPAGSSIDVAEDPPRFLVGAVTMNKGTLWYASVIAHDSYHSKLYRDYLDEHPDIGVPDNIYSGKQGEQKCIDYQADALVKMGADQATIDWVKNSINSNYWENPDRSW